MYDHRKEMWKIVRKTVNGAGGWSRFGNNWYYSQEEASQSIDRIIESSTDYLKDG